MSLISLSSIKPLTGYDDAIDWSFQIKDMLVINDYWDVVENGIDDSVENRKKHIDTKARAIISASINNTSIKREFMEKKSAKDFYLAIKSKYYEKDILPIHTRIYEVINSVFSTKILNEDLLTLFKIASDKSGSKKELSDSVLVGLILFSLKANKKYKDLFIKHYYDKTTNLDELLSNIQIRNNNPVSSKNIKQEKTDVIEINSGNSNTGCSNCGHNNHISNNCKRFCTHCKTKLHLDKTLFQNNF